MKGWPLLRALATLGLLLLLGWPLQRLTAPPAPVKPHFKLSDEPQIRVEKPESVVLEVTFTQPPQSFSVKYLGKEVLHAEGEFNFDYRQEVPMTYPPEGIDLVVKADWGEFFRKNGVSVKVIRPDGWSNTQALWGKKEVEDVLTFPGEEASPPPGKP